MKKFEILEHKADLKIRAFGKTKEELFFNILLGMSENMKPEIEAGTRVKREIKIESLDLPALLIDFLSEALYQSQINKEVYKNVKFSKFSDNFLEEELIGQKAARFGEDIKAATHHDLEINQNKAGTWEATALFDI